MAGTIPVEIGLMRSLRVIELRTVESSLSGLLPTSFGDLHLLESVTFAHLDIQGLHSRPQLHFPHLMSLYVSQCPKLAEKFDHWLAGSLNLQQLLIQSTPFFGDVSALAGMSNLSTVTLESTFVSGTIPPAFWNLRLLQILKIESLAISLILGPPIHSPGLELLDLHGVGIDGTIPNSVGSLTALEHLSIRGTSVTGTFPKSIGNLVKLTTLDASHALLTGSVPSELGNLTSLVHLNLSSNLLAGPLPSTLARLKHLRLIDLSNNMFNHTLPSLSPARDCIFNASHNRFSGTIPHKIAEQCTFVLLSHNILGPLITSSPRYLYNNHSVIFATSFIQGIDLSFNRFRCPLPELPPRTGRDSYYDFHSNEFIGTVPSSYCNRGYTQIDLSNNLLTDASVYMSCGVNVKLANNRLSGPFPEMNTTVSLDVSGNLFTRLPSSFPASLQTLVASDNSLSGPIPLSILTTFYQSSLTLLDLSNNKLECTERAHVPEFSDLSHLFYGKIKRLSLANNSLHCTFINAHHPETPSLLESLDLSDNQLYGDFSGARFPSLVSLNLARNSFNGTMLGNFISNAANLGALDVSHNLFNFDLNSFLAGAEYLTFLNASNNHFKGSIELISLPSLQIADFSNNLLDAAPSFSSIQLHFNSYRLQVLSITGNPHIPPIYGARSKGLVPTNQATPLVGVPHLDSAYCRQYAFVDQLPTKALLYDQALFGYVQCVCEVGHFGRPAAQFCYECPVVHVSSGSGISPYSGAVTNLKLATCAGESLKVPNTLFMYDSHSGSSAVESLSTVASPSTLQPSYASSLPTLHIEACTYSCQGLDINTALWPSNISSATAYLTHLLATQCTVGAEGRLCSKCVCNDTSCYFMRGGRCAHCSHVLPRTTSIAIISAVIGVIVVVLSIIMTLVLRSKRTRRTTSWRNLPLFKRIFYRLLHLTSLGNVTITITFVQLVIRITNWDTYILSGILGTLNGNTDAFGLICLFPDLSRPMFSLVLKLLIPVVAIVFVGVGVLVASLVSRIFDRLRQNKISRSPSDEQIVAESAHLVELKDTTVDYPALALFTSASMSVTKFFYFGSALSSHEYLFASTQPATNVKYVQLHPWMKYEDAMTLIGVSIPWAIIFDLILPVLFTILCWRVRYTYHTAKISIYFGTFFETYSRKWFWWEMTNILKKLSIALILQGLPSTSALQSTLVVTTVAGLMFTQLSLWPWKRNVENIFAGVSSVLLIGAVLSSQSFHLKDSRIVSGIFMIASVLFVLANLLVIAFETWTESTEYEKQTSGLLLESGAESLDEARFEAIDTSESELYNE